MRVLVACEMSGVVRRAFRAAGHDAWSLDLLPAEDGSRFHMQIDLLDFLSHWGGPGQFDLMIAHPPCTHLAVSGARWFAEKRAEQEAALDFVRAIMAAPIPMIAVENPVSVISSRIRKPDQIIQPYQFGHPESKKTCLWLKNLPPLVETNNVYAHMMTLPLKERTRVHYMSPGADRGLLRSRTYEGIAEAMATQWGAIEPPRWWERETWAYEPAREDQPV
jgi:site-specific DNA-cytosine methylase